MIGRCQNSNHLHAIELSNQSCHVNRPGRRVTRQAFERFLQAWRTFYVRHPAGFGEVGAPVQQIPEGVSQRAVVHADLEFVSFICLFGKEVSNGYE